MNIEYLKIELIPGRSVTFAKPPTAKSILGLFRKYNCTEVELELFNSLIVPGRPELDNTLKMPYLNTYFRLFKPIYQTKHT